MPIFSRGVTGAANRDLGRILNGSALHMRPMILAAARRLLAEVRMNPHLKGVPEPMPGYPHARSLDDGPLRIFYWVRQPPLMDLYRGHRLQPHLTGTGERYSACSPSSWARSYSSRN